MIGGAVTFVNPEPLAPFADVIAAGEGEVLVPALDRAFREAHRTAATCSSGWPRAPGFYVPSFYEPRTATDGTLTAIRARPGLARRSPCGRPPCEPPMRSIRRRRASSRPTPSSARASWSKSCEAARTCAASAGRATTTCPVRAFPADRILQLARSGAQRIASRVGLVSIALCDHPEIERILARLQELGYAISPASLRLDDLTETIVERLRASGERGITIAPETGSDRLRRVINKTVTNDEILDRADLIFASGIENLKLYYMIGLPTETDDDLVAIRDLTLQMRERMLAHAKAPRAHRPHRRQRESADSEARHRVPMAADGGSGHDRRKIKRLRSLMADIDNVYFNIKSERHSYYQALLVPRRPARRAGDRGRGAERPELACRRGRDRGRRRLLTSSAIAAATPCCRGTSSTAA